jgi:epoxyqueuosine reductase
VLVSYADQLAAKLRQTAAQVGLAAVGFAPATPMEQARAVIEERKAMGFHDGMQFTYRNPARSTDPGRALPGAVSLVVGAWAYEAAGRREPATGRPVGQVAGYARHDYYADLRDALGALAQVLAGHGWRARVLVDDNALVDRAAAFRAGLGWFGKNGNLLLPGRGSWFVLGSVVTDASLPVAVEPVPDGCGTCRRCQASCPTGALVRPGVLDARRCLAWLLQAPGDFPFEYREDLGDRIYGCDDCQTVCPVNRLSAGARHPPGGAPAAAGGDTPYADLLEVLALSDAELLERYGRWYVPARDPRHLRRNALVVLGNVADGRASAVARALERYLGHADDMLRAHAVWAAFRLGRPDLVEAMEARHGELPPAVRLEVARRAQVTVRGAQERPAANRPSLEAKNE